MASRAPKGQGMIRHRSDGLWQARFRSGYNPTTGKAIIKSIYGKTQQQVRKKLTAAMRDIDNGDYMEPSKTTVASWCKTWLQEYSSNLKPSTLQSRTSIINNRIIPTWGKVKLGKLTTDMIQTGYNRMRKEGLKSIHNVHIAFGTILNQAVKNGMIQVNPIRGCVLPKQQKHKITTLQTEQLRAYLQKIRGSEYQDILRFIVFSGLRISQAYGLTWDAVNFDERYIIIDKQLRMKSKVYTLVPTKFQTVRTIRPAESVFQILMKVLEKQQYYRKQLKPIYKNDLNLVFTQPDGTPLCRDYLRNFNRRIAQQIGIEKFRVHDLRHTYATLSLKYGDDIKTVSESLGHASAAFTMNAYTHVTTEMQQASAKRMQQLIDAVIQPQDESQRRGCTNTPTENG